MATAKKQSAPAATVDLQGTRCTCGCGETTPSRSRFRPGHDQRLKGQLARTHHAAVQVATLPLVVVGLAARTTVAATLMKPVHGLRAVVSPPTAGRELSRPGRRVTVEGS